MAILSRQLAPVLACAVLGLAAASALGEGDNGTDTEAAGVGSIDQTGAQVPVGGQVSFYTVGSSNAAWQTWPDHLHALLRRLGYKVAMAPMDVPGATSKPSISPVCQDKPTYATLDTPRVGMIGWASWGFSYDDKTDCDAQGFRTIAGYPVSCTNAWSCNPAWTGPVDIVPVTRLARSVASANFVLLANWVNDGKEALTKQCRDACYRGANITFLNSTVITEYSIKRVIRAIHAVNSNVVVLVLARYADTRDTVYANENTLPLVQAINADVKRRLEGEPNTYWVEYDFPLKEDMFQSLSKVHPNCRGDKVMATAVLETLFQKKVLSRGLVLGNKTTCLGKKDCASLDTACCHRSALCYVSEDGSCQPYGPGVQ